MVMVIEVTTSLRLGWCAAGCLFAAQYFVCRVLIANYYWWVMIKAALTTSDTSV